MLISLRKNRSLHLTGTDFFESRTAQDYRLLRNNEESIMFYALSWSVVISAASGVEGLRLPEWLAPWVPPEIVQAMTSLLSGLAPAVESLIQAAPALAGGLTVATWVIWGLGSVLLVLVGAGLHLLIAMWRRRGGGSGPQPRPQVTA
jgi:hypothetical protein